MVSATLAPVSRSTITCDITAITAAPSATAKSIIIGARPCRLPRIAVFRSAIAMATLVPIGIVTVPIAP